MADNSKIEWTGSTWNPIVGCSILSPGCIHCYAMPEAARQIRCAAGLKRETHYAGTVKTVKGKPVWTGKVTQAPDSILLAPLKRKKPTTYFVNSMSDLFHENVPDEWIDRIFAVMALTPQHTYQVLTKRAERMRDYITDPDDGRGHINSYHRVLDLAERLITGDRLADFVAPAWPLPNVWLGVSTERQQEADERIPLLLQTPAAVRFISAEPLLGPIDLARIAAPKDPEDPEAEWFFDSLVTGDYYEQRISEDWEDVQRYDSGDGPYRETKIDWVITGGESGPDARPSNPQWYRDIRDQCAGAETAYFHKQNGEWVSCSEVAGAGEHFSFPDGRTVRRVGKNRAGRTIDGIEHNAMPGQPA